ncbi:hypothetical protein HZY97_16255 [Sphingomonas sp. R-74633]|uniref:hypothetical protein n=1 Tax=Sphingomonas sp. R-74633 TaxID=2751188 RepID=UPI0015D3F002|nr:hypothetical protein [Sphingomonas sp. R-74633]NYT42326.1 hypothetical protein [Sphingomonas sp. R-74633]
MPLPLLLIAAGIKAAGSIAQGNAARASGDARNRMAQWEAQGIERDAAAQAAGVRDEVRRTMGTQIAAQGESGFELGTGSALDALMSSQVEGMLDQMNVRARGHAQADARRYQGRVARMEGIAGQRAGFYGAASALVGGASDYAKFAGAAG